MKPGARSIQVLERFCVFGSGIFATAVVFLLVVIFFAPGPVLVNGVPVQIDDFRGIGFGLAGAAAIVSVLLGAAAVGIRRQAPWFRASLFVLACAVMTGGAIANLVAGSVLLAGATVVAGLPALAGAWAFLYRSAAVRDHVVG